MKASERIKAESLRHQGISIKEIARRVAVSQSTASRWCSGVALTKDQKIGLERKRREAGAKALAPWIQRNRALKQDDIKKQNLKGIQDLGKMTKRDLFMLGLGLYWGGGYKRGSQEWGFTNSDSRIIRPILVWLDEYYGVPVERIIARLTINERYRDQTARLTHMWSRETDIPLSQFGNPTYISGYNESKLHGYTYRGTLRIKVRRGTSLRRRTLASIAAIEHQMILNSRKTAS
jgi:transcriptional regulator with XRE-family HTH domain